MTAEAVLYHRVSTLDQNPQLARDELRRAAAMRELAVLESIEETGSGRNNDRPGLQRALKVARGRTLICWKLDRFGRSALDVLTNMRAHVEAGGRFIACSQGIDIHKGEAAGMLLMTMLAAVAEFERNVIVERTQLGLKRAAEAGRFPGRPKGSKDRRPRRKKGGRVFVIRSVEAEAPR